jgi:ankyrin repeat protein
MTELVIDAEDPVALAAVDAIHSGDVAGLQQLLSEHTGLARTRLIDKKRVGRTLLHVAADWPGHFPNGAATVAMLAEAGADVNARCSGPHTETPLHWAASSNDIAVLDALLDAGADIDAPGSVIDGGSPLSDARAFAQWDAARRLVERGARTALKDAATLGLMDRVESYFAAPEPPSPTEVSRAFWGACHGNQRAAAEYLLARGADIDWIPPWEQLTPLDAATRQGAEDLVQSLRARGARSANELK